ncbi:hypothetical protein MBT84_39325 [Streptomyces sp. MBT84]|nr:hypothetical protein [Streptomyces sp. MBT84]
MPWLSGYRRLSPRYECDPRNYLAFLGLAPAMCCYKRLVQVPAERRCRGLASVLGQPLIVTSFATAAPVKQMRALATSQRSGRNPSRRPRPVK